MTKTIKIAVDFGDAFTHPKGSWYCGTTEQQKDNAAAVSRGGDLFIYLVDVHTRTSTEFSINGGKYEVHNVTKKDQRNLEALGVDPTKTASPQLTEKLQDIVKDKKAGLIVPRNVFFQDYDGGKKPEPAFTLEDVEETFGVESIDPQDFLDGKIDYVINAKHYKDGTRGNAHARLGHVPGVPDEDWNVFSLLKEQYGNGEGLQFDIVGVVMGICIYQTACGIFDLFPRAEINVIADACTHLVYEPLGIESEETGNLVAKKMCQQIGVNYMSTEEYLREKD